MVDKLEKTIRKANINFYKVFISIFHFLKKSYILDFGSSIYMMKDKHRFLRYKPALQEDRLKYRKGWMII